MCVESGTLALASMRVLLPVSVLSRTQPRSKIIIQVLNLNINLLCIYMPNFFYVQVKLFVSSKQIADCSSNFELHL